MANLITPKILKGFRDSLPEQEISKQEIITSLEHTFQNFGFAPVDTPVLEYSEILLEKGGGETEKQIYRFQDHGGRDVAMRFDLTVPFARFMAQHTNELPSPFRRYHISKVWRGENTQKGRYREFMQCDFDIVGTDSPSSDMEILILMHESLATLNLKDITIHISHRGVLNSYLKKLGVSNQSVEILRTIDKLNKIGTEKVYNALTEIAGEENAQAILDFITPSDKNKTTLDRLEELVGSDNEDLNRLKEIYYSLTDMGYKKGFCISPSITRGLDYYTGIVFETFLDKLPGIGSVCSGGRYNDLAGLYTNEKLPGVGASIGLDRLLSALDELGATREISTYTKVCIFHVEDGLLSYYHNLASKIRKKGIAVEVFPENKKLKKQFSYAEKKGIPIAVICGPEEKEADTLTFKDLKNRENYENWGIEKGIEKISSLLK